MTHREITGSSEQVVIYPILETRLTYHADGKVKEWLVPSCCFHDLASAPDRELAGMGLAIIGNIVKHVGKDIYNEALDAKLLLKRYPTDTGIELAWPGMPNDAPLPLDLIQMPFDVSMFIDDDGKGTHRIDRLALMRRIEVIWVPFLKEKLCIPA